jgi:hypothetical protein
MFKGDKLKVVETSMLTLEFAPNNKTGNLKVPLRGNFIDWTD